MSTNQCGDLPPYPGRGLLVGRLLTGELIVLYYITGRSKASKERTLRDDGDTVSIIPYLSDNSDPLRHYTAVIRCGAMTTVGNGDHVSQISSMMAAGESFCSIIGRLSHEPDAPIYTPRLAAIVRSEASGGHCIEVGTAKRGAGGIIERRWVGVEDVPLGTALATRTYDSDGDSIAPNAQPEWVTLEPTLEATADAVWVGLDSRFRVVVWARALSLSESVLRTAHGRH